MRAAYPVRAMLDNVGSWDRDLPDLLAVGLPFGREIRRQQSKAPRARCRAMVNETGQISRAELNSGVTGVAGLTSPFAARRHRFGARWGARRVSRGRA